MIHKEDDLQMQVAKYLDLLGLDWFHPANERRTSIQAGVRLKKKGVKSGVPDVMIFNPKKGYNGLAIELKIGKNKPSQNQLNWIYKLDKNNWKTDICYNFDEFLKVIDSYIK